MKKTLVVSAVVGLVASMAIGAAVTMGASEDTSCWDEYNNRGTRFYGTVAPQGMALGDCTPGNGCFWRYSATGKRNRLYVPHQASPATGCDETVPTTEAPTTTLAETTNPGSGSSDRFELLPVGAALPSDAECAVRVRPMSENRDQNSVANATRGSSPNATYPRVTGDFTGTTDEILQWAACKWGIDEDWVRAQINNESSWRQDAKGDFATDGDPARRDSRSGSIRRSGAATGHIGANVPNRSASARFGGSITMSAFEGDNTIDSSAYNVDYTYAVWRECYEGRFDWLNGVEGRGDYTAGDAKGCLGVWFSGRWYTEDAVGYIARFEETLANQPWTQEWFPPALPVSGSTGSATVTAPATRTPATTAPATTAHRHHQSGDDRSGDDGSGDDRSGDDRSGDDRSGDDRSGNDRSGNQDSGHDRSGHDRSGDHDSRHPQSAPVRHRATSSRRSPGTRASIVSRPACITVTTSSLRRPAGPVTTIWRAVPRIRNARSVAIARTIRSTSVEII